MDEWQVALRKQFSTLEDFTISNIGPEIVFSDYAVYNPLTNNSYKVSVRSNSKEIQTGKNYNFCTCYDFKTNGLGTCKHIEAVINQINSKKTTSRIFEQGNFQPTYSSVYLEYGPDGRQVKLRIGSEDTRKLKSLSGKYFSENGNLKSTGFEKFDEFLAEARHINQDFRCYEDATAFILKVRDKNRRKAWIWKNQLALQNGLLSNYIKAELHPYQKKGVTFAVQAGRALIADEMGLGKTLQAITAAEVLKKNSGFKKSSLYAPPL